ncbi:MAG TPA: hypothetical protein VFI46_06230 [Jiangellaceae bacterium]|nr:hypothetical protein [Jiangellaceae bacterium]
MRAGTWSRSPDVESPVRRFQLLIGMTAAALLLAACGDDDPEVATDEPPPPSDRYQHSTDPDAVVLRISDEGGFVPAEHSFINAPRLLMTGDGRLIQGGPVMAIYPGPLLPNLLQRSISEAGIQRLIKLADERGLLADVAYPRPANIADAADTVMTITVGGETFEHRAYALGLGGGPEGGETDEARARLFDFVGVATGLTNEPASGDVGPEQPYRSDTYMIRAREAGSTEPTDDAPIDIVPTLVDWPADAPVRLAAAGECAEVPTNRFSELFQNANQLTRFVDDGVSYSLAVTPRVPGRSCSSS